MEHAKHVFLTGASGFVASQILAGLIERNYHITASVRSQAKAEEILALHPSWAPQLSFVYIADVAQDSVFNDVFMKASQPFDYVIHTASPVNFSITDFQRDLIDPAVQGSVGLLQSAHAHGGHQLQRFVLLGSAVSCLDSFQDISVAGKPYTEKDWNPVLLLYSIPLYYYLTDTWKVTAAQAIASHNPVLGYNASKKLAEEAAWAFMTAQKPAFDLVVICPDIIIGPMLQPVSGPKAVNETNSFAVYNFMNGVYSQIEGLTFPYYHCVDVRDVARAHILALTTPAASGQRILTISEMISPQLVINAIRKHFPELHSRVMEGEPTQILPRGNEPTGWDTSRSTEILGGKDWKYIGMEEAVVDTVRSLLALEAGWGL